MANFKTLLISSIFVFSISAAFAYSTSNEYEGTTGATSPAELNERLNINQATYEDLIKIKGLGPAKAKAILSYIEAHGDLVSLDELMEIRGIGKRLLAKLKLELRL